MRHPADLVFASLATHFVPAEQMPSLRASLLRAAMQPGGEHAAVQVSPVGTRVDSRGGWEGTQPAQTPPPREAPAFKPTPNATR